jgi:hypothetical protein
VTTLFVLRKRSCGPHCSLYRSTSGRDFAPSIPRGFANTSRASSGDNVAEHRKKGEMTVREAGHLGIKKVAHKGGEATASKVRRIREENKEMGPDYEKELQGKKKGEMTVAEAGHLGGKKGGHKGGETVAKKVPRIREENIEREEHRPETKEERERVEKLVHRLKEEYPKR